MGKIIEFYGPPGAGKTTLANYAKEYLKENEIPVFGRKEAEFFGYKEWLKRKDETKYPTEKRIMDILLEVLPLTFQKRLIKSDIFFDRSGYYQDMINGFIKDNFEFYSSLMQKLYKAYSFKSNFGVNKKNKLHKDIGYHIGIFSEDLFRYQNAYKNLNKKITLLDEGLLKRISRLHLDIEDKYNKEVLNLVKTLSSKLDYTFLIYNEPEKCIERKSFNFKRNKEEYIIYFHDYMECFDIVHRTLLENGVKSFKINNNGSLDEAKVQLYPCLGEIIEDLEDTDD